VFDPDDVAVAVLKLCDGARTVADIAAVMAKEYNAPMQEIEADIIAMLQDLADKGVVKA
jgi:pyrroloquinoline quinone biosynthesis protein D